MNKPTIRCCFSGFYIVWPGRVKWADGRETALLEGPHYSLEKTYRIASRPARPLDRIAVSF